MSQQVTLNISDEMYLALQEQANAVGLSVADWLITILNKQNSLVALSNTESESQQQEAHQSLLNYAGTISLGYATGVENENIDTDLSKAYANNL
jgi:hypothetical protein